MAAIENAKVDVGHCLAMIEKMLFFTTVGVPQEDERRYYVYLRSYLDGHYELKIRIAGGDKYDLINFFSKKYCLT